MYLPTDWHADLEWNGMRKMKLKKQKKEKETALRVVVNALDDTTSHLTTTP